MAGAKPVVARISWSKALWEKLPFFAASAAAATIAYLVQRQAGAVKALPIELRAENALVCYVIYIGKTVWPTRLAVFYPYPAAIPAWQIALAAIALVGVTAAVLRWFRAYPYLAVGWFWYLGVLIPVIGLVQVGAQARADRHMYIPMTGLLIMLAWDAADVLRKWPRTKPAIAALSAAALIACAAIAYAQIEYWRNSESLFQHALNVTKGNYLAEHNLGTYLMDAPDRLPEAIAHLETAVRLRPDSAEARTDLGTALSKIPERSTEALSEYRAALRIAPDSVITHNNLGNTLSKLPGHLPEAISEYQAALRIKPDYPDARDNLSLALARTHFNQGVALAKTDRLPEAITQFEAALRIKPNFADAHNNLGVVLSQIPGQLPEAIAHFQAALRIRPDYADARYNLGIALSQTGKQ